MRIVVVGAGEVGSHIAASLADNHEIVVVDVDPEKVDQLTYAHDVLAIEGDGASLQVLEEADVKKADMLIASTDSDETNLIVCGTAKTVSDAFTVARVRNAHFLETWDKLGGAFDVDYMVSTNLLTANDIVRVVGLTAALSVAPFASGLVQMAEFEIAAETEVAGQTIEEADRFDALTFAALIRDGEVVFPRGETVMEPEDRVIVIGRPDDIQAFSGTLASGEVPETTEDIVIIGGSDIGYHAARLLEERGLSPRLIEEDPDRAREIAEELPGTVVMQHEVTDVEFLLSEHVHRADAVITATDSDERNLLVSLLAKNIGVRRTVAVVEEGEYADLFETVGIDVAINPREATAEEIVRFTQGGDIEKLSLIEGQQAEVLEIEIDEESVLAGRPIRESVSELPSRVVIGAITRQREFVIPRGDTIIEPGDHVVLFVSTDVLSDVIATV